MDSRAYLFSSAIVPLGVNSKLSEDDVIPATVSLIKPSRMIQCYRAIHYICSSCFLLPNKYVTIIAHNLFRKMNCFVNLIFTEINLFKLLHKPITGQIIALHSPNLKNVI